MDDFLFERGVDDVAEHATTPEIDSPALGGVPRLRWPERHQVEMRYASLDQLLEADHRARLVWALVERLDLSLWTARVKAVEGHVGRKATAPQLLVALWVFATLEGIAHARELERLCQKHLAYQWLCGGVTVNYHLLSDCRNKYPAEWDALLTQIVASLLNQGLVTLDRVAQDGMRVRASAGKSSFRRQETLEQHLATARARVAELRKLGDEAPHELTKRQQAARERAAREQVERLEAALANCAEVQAQRDEREKKTKKPEKPARGSTTDPEARIMQFANSGYAPGVNVQFSTDTASGIIVGVDAVSAGNDSEQLPPMLDQIRNRYGRVPPEAAVDGGFAGLQAIADADARGCAVFAPLKEEQRQLDEGKDPYRKRKGDAPGVAKWRARMGEAASKEIYKLRCQTAEWVNALARNRGLQQMPVRGLVKCRAVAMLYAIAHNLMHGELLRVRALAAK
jgi:transposase